jgi:uncharacterized protein (TIGR00304 family)
VEGGGLADSLTLIGAGVLLVLAGFALIFLGALKAAMEGGGRVEGGGVVMIGPVPIIFGSSLRAALLAMTLALALMILALISMKGAQPAG